MRSQGFRIEFSLSSFGLALAALLAAPLVFRGNCLAGLLIDEMLA